MDEDKKKQVAIFRFNIIYDLVGGAELSAGEQERLLRDKCLRKWAIPFSGKTRIGRSTILRWVRLYRQSNGKLEALYPQDRSDQGKCRILDQETVSCLVRLRKEFPKFSAKHLISVMNERGWVSPGITLNLSSVYRYLHQHGLMKLPQALPEDRRKFEAELPNDIWQSDCMHGPMVEHLGQRKKSYLIAFIDDHSRLIPHAGFYLSESVGVYLKALEEALLARGLPRKLYTDNGAAFRSHHLEHVTASLGIALIHSRPYKPQGRGKIERFFLTVRNEFLPGFKGKTLPDINEALDAWLHNVYHQRKHGGTGETPFARFTSHMECLRPAPKDLKEHFRKNARRKVAKDRTISLNGRLFEAPVVLIGKQVTLLYHENEPERVEAFLNQKSYGFLTPVNLNVNCRVKRDDNHILELYPPDTKANYTSGGLWKSGGEGK